MSLIKKLFARFYAKKQAPKQEEMIQPLKDNQQNEYELLFIQRLRKVQ